MTAASARASRSWYRSKRPDGVGVAGPRGANDLLARAPSTGEKGEVALEAGAGQECLDTPVLPAVALRRGRALLIRHPGERVVAPLAGDLVGSLVDALPDRDAAPYAGAENHAEHRVEAAARAVDRLGQREAVGVVGDAHRPGEPSLEVREEGPADEPGGVGVLDQSGGVADDAGNADAHGAGAPRFGLDLLDEARDRVEGAGVVVTWRGDPAPDGDGRVRVEADSFDLGAAQINADLHRR